MPDPPRAGELVVRAVADEHRVARLDAELLAAMEVDPRVRLREADREEKISASKRPANSDSGQSSSTSSVQTVISPTLIPRARSSCERLHRAVARGTRQ